MSTDQEQHRDTATRNLARYLAPRLTAGLDPHQTAAIIMQNLINDHWRCMPPPPAVQTARQAAAAPDDTAHRGAAYARSLLNQPGDHQ